MIRPTHLAALLVVAALGGGAVVLMDAEKSTSPSVTSVTPNSAADERTTSQVGGVAGGVEPDSTTTTTTMRAVHGPLATVEEGLAAWGRFAVSGELTELREWFDPEGPQFERLAGESQGLAANAVDGAPPYSVIMSDPVVDEVGDGDARVSGRVLFARTGEPSQSFQWVVIVRETDGTWRIWTVEESSES